MLACHISAKAITKFLPHTAGVLDVESEPELDVGVLLGLSLDCAVVLGSPVGCAPGAGAPVAIGTPSGPMEIAGKPGGGGIHAPGIGRPRGIGNIPAAAGMQRGQNLSALVPVKALAGEVLTR